jgi:IS30 family transposase
MKKIYLLNGDYLQKIEPRNRVEIELLSHGKKESQIASILNRGRSTIMREVGEILVHSKFFLTH